MDFKESGFGLVLGLLLLVIGIWWQVYKYHDCKKVGHTTMYCVLDIGK